jgi:dolichol-phosphate mannosyltransferase
MIERFIYMPHTLILCPVHNESGTLSRFISRLYKCTEASVLFIDDGSTDNSADIIRDKSKNMDKRMHLLRHPVRRGYGAALISGFQTALQCGYKNIITIDTDLQHRPEDIHRFERALEYSEVALGTRYGESFNIQNVPRSRYLINRYISGLFRKRFEVCFSDPFCGFRGYRRSFLKNINLFEQSYGICLEVLLEIIRTGASYDEVPVDMIYLDEGRQFMDGLDNPLMRLDYYRDVISRRCCTLKELSIAVCQ